MNISTVHTIVDTYQKVGLALGHTSLKVLTVNKELVCNWVFLENNIVVL